MKSYLRIAYLFLRQEEKNISPICAIGHFLPNTGGSSRQMLTMGE